MTKPKRSRPKPSNGGGIRATVWIPERHVKLWRELDNKSGFISLALDDAVGIMAWAIMRATDPERFHRPVDDKKVEDVLPEFNKNYPLNEENKQWPKSSKKTQENW